jgi:hypothetical protein
MEQQIRNINQIEKQIVNYLVGKADIDFPDERYEKMLVRKMDDGGMGSFSIFPEASDVGVKRKFGKEASEFEFVDDDGVLVIVSLYLDEEGKLLEVDVWKTNFNPVINFKIPNK